jgi:hypothetical protein
MALALRKRTGKVKRSTSNPGKQYLDKLKADIGEDKFDNLLGVKDEKTLLISAIDDTGSMGGEISASLAMLNFPETITLCLNYRRQNDSSFFNLGLRELRPRRGDTSKGKEEGEAGKKSH